MEAEGEDPATGNFDHEGRNRRRRNNKNRRKYFYVIFLIALVLLIIVGIILALTLTKKSSNSNIVKPVIQFLTISWFNIATTKFRIKRDSLETDDPRIHIKNSLNSDQWKQMINQEKNLQIRFLPYTDQAGNASNYYTSSTEAISALTNINPVSFSGTPSQENLADNYIFYLKQQQNAAQQILMLFAPPIPAYPRNEYQNDAIITGSKLSSVILTMDKIVLIAQFWNESDVNVYNLTGNNVNKIYGDQDIGGKIIGSIGNNQTSTTISSATTTTVTSPTSPTTSFTTVQVSSSSSTLPITSPTTTTTQAIPLTTTTITTQIVPVTTTMTTTTQIVPVTMPTTPTTTTTRVIPVTTPTTTTEVPVTTEITTPLPTTKITSISSTPTLTTATTSFSTASTNAASSSTSTTTVFSSSTTSPSTVSSTITVVPLSTTTSTTEHVPTSTSSTTILSTSPPTSTSTAPSSNISSSASSSTERSSTSQSFSSTLTSKTPTPSSSTPTSSESSIASTVTGSSITTPSTTAAASTSTISSTLSSSSSTNSSATISVTMLSSSATTSTLPPSTSKTTTNSTSSFSPSTTITSTSSISSSSSSLSTISKTMTPTLSETSTSSTNTSSSLTTPLTTASASTVSSTLSANSPTSTGSTSSTTTFISLVSTKSTSANTSTSTSILTTTIPVQVCKSYIPFSFDISLKLNSVQFSDLKTFLVNPFLDSLFPTNVQPLWYSTYANTNFAPRNRPSNVNEIINYVQTAVIQGTATTSDFSTPLVYFITKNVTKIGDTDGLNVNTVVFAGDSLPFADIATVQNYTSMLTTNGNTLTVVLMNPNIDTNYKQITGLNIVIWSDPATTIGAIRNYTNCPTGSSSIVSTTSGSSTLTTSTLSSSSSTSVETISSSVPSSPLPSSTTTGPTSSISTSETISVTTSNQTSTSPIPTSSTTGSSTSPFSTTISSTKNTPTSTETTTITNTSTPAISSTTTIPIEVSSASTSTVTVTAPTITSPTTTESTSSRISTTVSSTTPKEITTTTSIPTYICRSYIPFSFDVSEKLTTDQFTFMKTFLLHPFLDSIFPVDFQPAWFSTYSNQNYPYRRPANVSAMITFVSRVVQGASVNSLITLPLKYFVDQNVTNLATTELAVNTIIFVGNSLASADIPTIQNYTSTLTANGNTLTVVLVNPNIDPTNYRQIHKLNIVIWSDPVTTIVNILNVMNCPNSNSTRSSITTTGSTSISSSASTTTVTVTTPIITSPTTTESASSRISTTVSSTTPREITTTTSIPTYICRSYIPFSFDVSEKLTTDQFTFMKTFLLHPFLDSIFPVDFQPAWFSTYSNQNYPYRRPANVSAMISFVSRVVQGASANSLITLPLKYFVDQNVTNLATTELAVNTVIFAGNSLASADIPTIQNYTSTLTANGNTLTVVLVNPDIDQTNYQRVAGLNIVVWNNPATTIANIESYMNCRPTSPTSSATSTMPITTLSTSTLLPSTNETTTPVTISTVSSTSIESTIMTSTVATTTSLSSSSSKSTTPGITSSTTETTTFTSTESSSTSTVTNSPITTPWTTGSTSMMSTTTTISVPICKSYIPFSFDVSTDLTPTQFADLKAFLVNPFLESVFSQHVQPAWYSTYDSTNHNYTRPGNVADVINGVQSSIQSAATTSDFIQPLQYLVDQGVAFLGQTDGLAVNSIIFAGFSLDDVDTATFYATTLTSNGNTLTAVLMNSDIDQTNYRRVPGLNIVVWSDIATTINAIRNFMNCELVPANSTVITTMGMTTTSTSTLPPSTSETTTSVTITTGVNSTNTPTSTINSSTESTNVTTSTVPSSSLITPGISPSTANVSSSTSTVTSSPITTPLTTESTSMMSTTTTISVPICKSYIPFSFDVSTDLTPTQFADLKAFLVNPFLESVFSQDVQPAWYSTYDSRNHNYTRPGNVADVINGVQSSIQSAATTSDFIQPLQYLVDQGVAFLGQTDGLAVNSIIFAGFSLDDVDTATFYATTLTSNGNTLTAVLMNSDIDQTNYRRVPGLNIVVWSDTATTINAIRNFMNCTSLPSTTTVTTTTGITTTSTSTLPPSTSETTTSVTITTDMNSTSSPTSTIGSSTESTSVTTSSVSASTSPLTSTSSTSTISSSLSTTPETTTPTSTESSSTSTVTSSPITTPLTTESTSMMSTTTTISVPICKSYIPFSFDVSTDLTPTQFADLKAFLVNPFLESVFSQDVQPAWYSTYDSRNHNYTRPGNVADVINGVQSSIQSAATTSDFIQPLQYLVDQGVAFLGQTDGLAVNSIIFAGFSLDDVDTATFYATTLTSNGNTLTAVLINSDIDQTNYQRVPGLNIVVWSDTATTINAIRNFMNCTSLPSTTTVTTTTGITTTSTSTLPPSTSETTTSVTITTDMNSTSSPTSTIGSSTESTSVTTSSVSASTSPLTSTSSTSTISSSLSTTPETTTPTSTESSSTSTVTSSPITTPLTTESTSMMSTTTTISVPICKSYIPFSFDVSTDLTPTQFADLKAFLVNPFLAFVFSKETQPVWYSTYDQTNQGSTNRPNNVSEIVGAVSSVTQTAVASSMFSAPLAYFFGQNVITVGSNDGLFVNTIIFAGAPLSDSDFGNAQFYASILTANGNTLTVVLVNPDIDQTNYQRVPGLNIVVWSDTATTINAIRNFMNCTSLPSTTTVTTTTGITTTSTSTLPPSTSETTTSVTITTDMNSTSSPTSTIGSSTESTSVTTSSVSASTSPLTSTSSTSTISSSLSTTPETTTPTSTESSSTSTVTSSPITTPLTTESTSMMSTTTTISVPICKSYIPFSFDVSTDLTPTQFADLKAFLVNPFLESVFSQDVQPAWYSTYDSRNHNYTRPGNVADVINGVQSSIQSAATTSDFIQPLQYLVDQGVAFLGQTDGLAVNSIIFAGFSLDDVDTATFYATTLTSNGNTLTAVLINSDIDQTNYRRVPGLNIVVWSDIATTINAIRNFMNCTSLPSTTTVTTTTGITTTSTSTLPPSTSETTTSVTITTDMNSTSSPTSTIGSSTESTSVTTSSVSASTSPLTSTSSTSTISSSLSTTPETTTPTSTESSSTSTVTSSPITTPLTTESTSMMSTTTTISVPICKSYIPFSFDVSTDLTPTQFADLKAFLVNPFLAFVFSKETQPVWYSTYDQTNQGSTNRPNNVSEIVGAVSSVTQTAVASSMFSAPLAYFFGQNVITVGSNDGLFVNTIIFAGAPLSDSDFGNAQFYASILTANGNTLTVVLVNPDIDQTNYQRVPGLNIVVWSDTATTINAIRNFMNCTSLPSTTTVTTTTGITTTSTSTLPPSTSETTTSVTITTDMNSTSSPTSTIGSSTESTSVTTSSVSASTSPLTSTSSTSTISSSLSTTPETTTPTSTESSSTSTVTSSPITTPLTTESTSMMSTTTTISVPICKSYIPFSFDVSTDLTPTQFADLKAFLVNPFLAFVFSKETQPVWYSTYDQTNQGSTNRPNNVSEIVGAVSSVTQTAVASSMFSAPLAYFFGQNVITVGSNDGLFVNTIIFAGAPLSDSDFGNAQFYASILTANGNTLTVVLVNPDIDQTNYQRVPGLNIVVWSDTATTINAIRNFMNCTSLPSTTTVTTTTGITTTSTSTLPPSTSETTTVVITTEPSSTTTVFESTLTSVSTTTISNPAPSSTSTPESSSVSTSTETSSSSTTTLSISSTISSTLPLSSPTTTTETTTSPTTTLGPTTSTATAQPTTTHTYPRPIDIAVIFDGSVCSNERNLGEQLDILEKIFSEYTFGINVRVAFAKPINMGVEFIRSFVCDMASINSTVQSINEYCTYSPFLNPKQHLNDSMLGAMNVLYNQHSPALVFIVLLQSNGSTFANETTSVVNSAKYIRQTCLEPTNTKVVVVQVDNLYVVDPELASDGFFFPNTVDIGHRIGVALENVANYNVTAYTCAPINFKNLIPDPKESASCYANF